jgi:signal transduction histidine kinase
MTKARGVGLRTQILFIVLGGAIVPLALAGLWLTSSAVRSGERLLQTHLEQSADRFTAAVQTRWEYRRADILLIAGNEASVRVVTGAQAATPDSIFLTSLAAGLRSTIAPIELRDMAGRVRWTSTTAARAAPRQGAQAAPPLTPLIMIETAIEDSSGARVGTAVTGIAMSGLIPPDSARPLVPGAMVGVRNATTRNVALPLAPAMAFPADSGRVAVGRDQWRVALRRFASPPIDIAIGAPLEPYVAPFEGAARVGIAALLVVALGTVVFTVLLAMRATRPLRDLVDASESVTRGSLDQSVSIAGPAEVQRVGAAFNTMTGHLRRTLDELSRRSALAAVGEFATTLSHDVRNALTAIKVDLERAELRGVADPVASGLVARALGNVARLETVVSGALRVARRGHAPPKEIDLRVPLDEAVASVRGAFAAASCELEVSAPPSPVVVCADTAALQQMFANLLFNAAQAMRPGGRAHVAVSAVSDFAEVTIRDSGVGIAPGDMEQLATPFFSTKPSGTGLGLPIARQIVAAHGGDLSITSETGAGTTVRVRLPLVNASFRTNERNVQPAATAGV